MSERTYISGAWGMQLPSAPDRPSMVIPDGYQPLDGFSLRMSRASFKETSLDDYDIGDGETWADKESGEVFKRAKFVPSFDPSQGITRFCIVNERLLAFLMPVDYEQPERVATPPGAIISRVVGPR